MNLCKKELCTACGACVSKCPKGCISYKTDKYGFEYPYIDRDTCVNCGKCNEVCHVINSPVKKQPLKAYAAWSKDSDDRKTSTSGGIASVFYDRILSDGGCCFGAEFDNNLNAVISGYNDSRVKRFKKSKYVHSDMADSYSRVKEQLENNSNVIFIGLPCQAAALKTYLNKDYEKLTVVDIVCHGVPPKAYLRSHIDYINQKTEKIADNVDFRENSSYFFKTFKNGKLLYKKHCFEDTYLYAFNKTLSFYESCYRCVYSCGERCSDITIGDFWGLGEEKPFEHSFNEPVSLILVNTEKGESFFDSVKSSVFCEQRDISEAVKRNDNLKFPSKRNGKRDKFLENYTKYGFEKSVRSLYRMNFFVNKILLSCKAVADRLKR